MDSTLLKIIRARIRHITQMCLVILFALSCQTTLRLLESNSKEQYLAYQEDSNYCRAPTDIEFSSDQPYLVDFAVRELATRYQKGQLTFNEVIQVFALAHLIVAPDRFSASARFQFLSSKNKKSKVDYLDLFAKDPLKSHSSFLAGIRSLAPQSLTSSINLAGRLLPERIQVDHSLSDFLSSNKNSLLRHKAISSRFFKGELALQEGETFERISADALKRAFSRVDPIKNYYKSDHLFNTSDQLKNKENWACSFDLGIYTNSIYLVRDERKLQTGLFGVRSKAGQWFMGSTAFNPEALIVHPALSSWWSTTEKTPPSAFCYRKNDESTIALVSTKDRDPGQHLYHLIELEDEKIPSLSALQTYLDFTRYLILFTPERIVLESRRASKAQVESYQQFPFPLYHAEKLGKIWGYGEFPGKESLHGFVIDGREEGYLSCP